MAMVLVFAWVFGCVIVWGFAGDRWLGLDLAFSLMCAGLGREGMWGLWCSFVTCGLCGVDII